MNTSVLAALEVSTRDAAVRSAAGVLRAGGLVAFPTETVYGLGAAASNEAGVRRIFAAKGRPSGVPLIVHVTDIELASRYVKTLPRSALVLAQRFWPGPLTIVLPRADDVSLAVTGGGETVAVRAPAHDVALSLIRELDEGIAAPSANRYNALPPVRGQHVLRGLGGSIDCVLDAGRCPGGLESTVLDLTSEPPRVLRRGAVTLEQLRAVLDVHEAGQGTSAQRVVDGAWLSVVEPAKIAALLAGEARVGVLVRGRHATPRFAATSIVVRQMPGDAAGYASELYDTLHELRDAGCERVLVEALPGDCAWDAMRDRLVRLATSMAR